MGVKAVDITKIIDARISADTAWSRHSGLILVSMEIQHGSDGPVSSGVRGSERALRL